MRTRIGDRVQPAAQLLIEVFKIAESATEKEILADIAERPLDFALRLGPIGPAGARLEAVVPGEIDKGAVVDDKPLSVFADHGRLHSVIEDRARRAAHRFKRSDMTPQNGLQILVQHEARPDQPRIAHHHREQPDDTLYRRLVGELDFDLAKSTCACSPGGVSKRTSKPEVRGGLRSRTPSRTVL